MIAAPRVSNGAPLVGNLFEMRRDLVGFLVRVARENGDVAWSRQGLFDLFVVSGPDPVHEVLVEKSDAFVKSFALSVYARPILGDGLLTLEHDAHREQRRRLAPAFAHKRVAAYAALMIERAEAAAERILARERVDFADEMMRTTLEIVGKALFDSEIGSDADEIAAVLTEAMHHLMTTLLSIVPLPPSVPTPRNRRARQLVDRLDAIVYRIIEQRRRSTEDRGDVLSILLAPGEDGSRLSDREVRDHVMTLLLAGHETTANLLAWTFAELARHPQIRARVEAEADAAFAGREGKDGFELLRQLPFCLAVLKESMRLHPPAYNIGRRAEKSVTIGGQLVPKGRFVVLNVIGMHRRPDLFERADEFDPDRFSPGREKAIPKHAYVPFADGPRVCIGNQFSLMEGQLVLATLARRLRLSLEGPLPLPEPTVTLRPLGGVPMFASARR